MLQKKRGGHIHAELKKFLDVYMALVADTNDQNEKKLDEAGMNFINKFNEGSLTEAPRTRLTKWIGRRGYFIIYFLGMILIGLGLVMPTFSNSPDDFQNNSRHFYQKNNR